MPLPRSSALTCAAVLFSATLLPAAEPWADPKLRVTSGLELWLDAGRIIEVQKALKQPALKDQAPLEVWPDASGKGRDVRQAKEAARPRLVHVGADWLVRFDGKDDHLRA